MITRWCRFLSQGVRESRVLSCIALRVVRPRRARALDETKVRCFSPTSEYIDTYPNWGGVDLDSQVLGYIKVCANVQWVTPGRIILKQHCVLCF